MEQWPIIWTQTVIRIDEETGEIITKYMVEKITNGMPDYIKTKTIKNATLNTNKSKGHIERTIKYRKQPQLKLW